MRIIKTKRKLLSELIIEITERCNNNCIHCCINLHTDNSDAKKSELSTEDIKEILAEAVSLGCFTVRFTGGEPFLRDDFEELYIYARKLGLRVLIFTNATLLTDKLATLFSLIPPLEEIEISLYGLNEESYEAVTRTPGSFFAAYKGIQLLKKYKIPFVIKGIVLPLTQKEMPNFQSWAMKTLNLKNTNVSTDHLILSLRYRRDSEKKNNQIKNLRLQPEEVAKTIAGRKYYSSEMKEFFSKFFRNPSRKLFLCGAGNGLGCVDSYGNLLTCLSIRHPCFQYDLKKGSLYEAAINFFPKIREIIASNSEYINRCAKCFLFCMCQQCPGKSWVEHGNLDTPVEYLCKITHSLAKILGLIKTNECAWEVIHWEERLESFLKGKNPLMNINYKEDQCIQK